MKLKPTSKIITYLTTALLLINTAVAAQEYSQLEPIQKNYQGIIENVANENTDLQNIDVRVTNLDKINQVVRVLNNPSVASSTIEYKKGDKVLILEVTDKATSQSSYYITGFDRTGTLLLLFLIFCGVVVLVSKKWGVYSLIGMFYSFFIIFKFILPQLLKGHNPLFIVILGALFITPVTFYLSHGVNRKTAVALLSTVISLLLTGILSVVFINLAKLTGFGSDEALFLQIIKEGTVNIKGIFLAGIIIGTLGILDDVTISQSSIVYQLKSSIKGINNWDLYKKAMAVGHDHIASTVNTLVLVYTGAALPLLLLFINSTKTFGEAINAEIIADEIVRTLAGSIGLVLAVPISTLLAVLFANDLADDKSHKHRH